MATLAEVGCCLMLLIGLCCDLNLASVLAFNAGPGESCAFSDGAVGRCEELRSCLASDGIVKRNKQLVRCTGAENFGQILVCCRKPKLLAKKLCDVWKPYWRQSSIVGNDTCVSERPMVYGGVEATWGEFPSMVALGYRDVSSRNVWDCGGTLLTPTFVMTAAHCLGMARETRLVGLGEHDLNLDNFDDLVKRLDLGLSGILADNVNTRPATQQEQVPMIQIIEVETALEHPDYETSYHDIAMLRLKQPARLTPRVLPSCLPFTQTTETFSSTSQLVVAGWGSLSYGIQPATAGKRALQRARLNYIDNALCTLLFGKNPLYSPAPWGVTADLMCAGGDQRDACHGDSGGPLLIAGPGIRETRCTPAVTVGVVAFGNGGCESFGAYTRVSSYLDWIMGIIVPGLDPDDNNLLS